MNTLMSECVHTLVSLQGGGVSEERMYTGQREM